MWRVETAGWLVGPAAWYRGLVPSIHPRTRPGLPTNNTGGVSRGPGGEILDFFYYMSDLWYLE